MIFEVLLNLKEPLNAMPTEKNLRDEELRWRRDHANVADQPSEGDSEAPPTPQPLTREELRVLLSKRYKK